MSSMAPSKEDKRKFFESICDLQIPNSIKFSPNAQYVLYSTSLSWSHKKGKNAVSTLWLAETGKPGSSRQITPGSFKDHSPSWSPDGKSIAFISDRPEAGKKWAIYLLNFNKGVAEGEAYPVTPASNEQSIGLYKFSPDGRTILYIAADEKSAERKRRENDGEDWEVWDQEWQHDRLRIVDLSTKETTVLTTGTNATLADRTIKEFCWSPDGRKVAVASISSPHIEAPYYTGTRISVLSIEEPDDVKNICLFPPVVRDLVWAKDGQLYFLACTKETKDQAGQRMYKVSPETAFSADKPTHNWHTVTSGADSDVVGMIDVAGDVVAHVQHGLADCIYLAPDRLLYSKDQQIEAYAATHTTDSDKLTLALVTSDINNPIEVFTTTASGNSLVQLSNHGSIFKDQHFGTCHVLSHPSLDNEVQLDNLFLSPGKDLSKPIKPLATIVLVHGGPWDRNTNRFDGYYYFWAPYLLRRGYGILLTNYRGSSGKGEHFASYNSDVGVKEYQDVISATQHAIEEGYADKERLVIGGVSQGGFMSYLASTRNGKHGLGWRFKASIPVSGVTDTDAMTLESDLGGSLEQELVNGRAPWNQPRDNIENRQSSAIYEVYEAVERSKKEGQMVIPPMLILHGEKDARCPLWQAIGMRRALMAHGLPFEMVVYPRQPHMLEEQKHRIDMMERIERWCETYIGPGELSLLQDSST